MKDASLTIVDPTTSTRLDPDDADPHGPKVGRWFWVKAEDAAEAEVIVEDGDSIDDDDDDDDDVGDDDDVDADDVDADADDVDADDEAKAEEPPWMACVVYVGTNYAKLQGVNGSHERIHFDHFTARCTLLPDPQVVIDANITQHRMKVGQFMREIHELTKLLGVPAASLLQPGAERDDGTRALVAQGQGRTDFKAYEASLVEAKDKTLPRLFEQIHVEQKAMAMWMEAALIPLEAEAAALKPVIEKIKGTIFKVQLYAGLVEDVVQIVDGTPAPLHEQIRLFQRRHYMDEECLIDYQAGGMNFRSINEFDAWLARPVNRDRILPFPRCIVAFRIRRCDVDREAANLSDFIRIQAENEENRKTFLYIRNGEQLFCLRTGIEFGAQLFPDIDRMDLNGDLWAKLDAWHKPSALIPQRQYQDLVERKAAHDRLLADLDKAGSNGRWKHHCDDCRMDMHEYHYYSPTSVYYDDITRYVQKLAQEHNQLSLVLQGLLDRSLVLHPHPTWQLHTSEGFAAALTLVFDDSRTLVDGPKPDFEAYRAKLNATLTKGSITVGQDLAWARTEAEKEDKRRRDGYSLDTYRPYGNPGPGIVARVVSFSKAKHQASFEWQRRRQGDKRVPDPTRPGFMKYDETPVTARFTCKADVLLNIDAYQVGDYKQFYENPQTRAEYLEWAPFLLVAEDYKAGKRQLGETEDAFNKRRQAKKGD